MDRGQAFFSPSGDVSVLWKSDLGNLVFLLLFLLEARHVQGLEIDRLQDDRRESGTAHRIGNDFARIREQDVGAGNGQQRFEIFLLHVADVEKPSLTDFHQEHVFLAELGGYRGGQQDFKNIVSDFLGIALQLETDFRRPVFQVDGRRVGNFQREILDVEFLNGKRGIFLF